MSKLNSFKNLSCLSSFSFLTFFFVSGKFFSQSCHVSRHPEFATKVRSQKHFLLLLANRLDRFWLKKHFHPSFKFETKFGTFTKRSTLLQSRVGSSPHLQISDKAIKDLQETNALAYLPDRQWRRKKFSNTDTRISFDQSR
jgi:hypothetical protein